MYSEHRSILINLPKSKPVDIEFQEIAYAVSVGRSKDRKEILKGVSGKFKSGELTAIMGPSGAGKSSLLNILTGLQQTGVSGVVSTSDCLGDSKTVKQYRKQSSYILQDDQLLPLFTVQEAMTMAADLKVGGCLSAKAKQIVIEDILDTLGLATTVDTRCDRLSGGQRKRLSIALELIDNPPVLFLDEPTTGLDSSSSLQCIAMLKALARGGRTIVCTIHQPSATVFAMCDQVYVLAEGQCVYRGSTGNVIPYLGALGLHCPQYHNPADYLLEVANCEYGNFTSVLAIAAVRDICCLQSEKHGIQPLSTQEENGNTEAQPDQNKTLVLITPPSEFTRFWVLLKRSFVQLYRDWTVTHLKVVLHIFVAIVLGLIYGDAGANGSKTISNVGYLLVTIVYLCYTSMMPAVLRLPSEIPIIKKESFNNWYKLRTYYAAFLISNIPIQIMLSFVHTGVSYFMSTQPPELSRFLMFMIVCALVTLCSDGLGIVIGTLVNPVNGTFFGAIFTCAMLIYAGFLVLFAHMSAFMYYVSYLSYMRYALEALVLSLYGFERERLPCPEDVEYCHLRSPQVLFKEMGMENGVYWQDVCMLIGYFIIVRLVGFFTFRRNIRRC